MGEKGHICLCLDLGGGGRREGGWGGGDGGEPGGLGGPAWECPREQLESVGEKVRVDCSRGLSDRVG